MYLFFVLDERAEQRKDEDFDEVVEQQLWDEMEDDNYILTKAADVVHAMLKVHKANYLPYMEPGIIPMVTKLIVRDIKINCGCVELWL